VLKDTNAQVRDAAVAMIIAIKIRLIDANENIQLLVDEAVNLLPKYRVTEINKKASEATGGLEIEDKDEIYHKTMVTQPQKSDMILGGEQVIEE
jgi:hypothetical protein